ncbi:MAG: hypothetical protein JW789_01350 [Candidatus Aenigmarchaeota archaeon]|nr:hypothetical protein [Candidatus Aenigmarchaeota archaeon]
MDEKILFSEFATGLAGIVASTYVFWYWVNFAGFIISFILGIAGLLLSSSRFLIIYHTESRKKPYAWIILSLFAVAVFTLIPVWCHETHIMGKEFTYCAYENLWDHFIFGK